MTEYFVPTRLGESEVVEKRSRFLGRVAAVETEAEARAFVERVKKEHYDARHNCWCYRLHQGGGERCSDDGEPQGTAGAPMLNVLQREGVENVVCVVTRYFGGVLLGAGGLVRAYTQSAKEALDDAGISVVRRWLKVSAPCSYALLERVKLEVEACGGVLGEIDYAADVTVGALLPEGEVENFARRITELSAGTWAPEVTGEVMRPAPRE